MKALNLRMSRFHLRAPRLANVSPKWQKSRIQGLALALPLRTTFGETPVSEGSIRPLLYRGPKEETRTPKHPPGPEL